MSLGAIESPPRVVRFKALPYQHRVLTSQKELIFLGAGLGTGKTDCLATFSMLKAQQSPEHVRGLIAANSYTQLRDSTMWRCYQRWREFGLTVRPSELSKGNQPFSVELWNGSHWVEILCRSMDNFNLAAGLELGWFAQDEAWDSDRRAFETLVERMRDKRMPLRQGLVASWLDEPTHWMHEVFVDNYDPVNHERVYARTADNKHLPPGYLRTLQATHSAAMYKRLVENKWLSLRGASVYHAFERQDVYDEGRNLIRSGNVSELAEFDPALPILWTHDFNIGQGKPMSSALAQIKRGLHGPVLDVFDEQILESTDTNDTILEFRQRYPAPLGARIYGDASGRAKDTRSKTTDYELLRAAGFVDQRVPKANPPIRDRHNAVNALLCNAAGHVRLRIHPRCKVLIKGLETVKLRSGAQYLEEETFEQHVTTALGYLVCQEFPVVERRVESGNLAIFRRR